MKGKAEKTPPSDIMPNCNFPIVYEFVEIKSDSFTSLNFVYLFWENIFDQPYYDPILLAVE